MPRSTVTLTSPLAIDLKKLAQDLPAGFKHGSHQFPLEKSKHKKLDFIIAPRDDQPIRYVLFCYNWTSNGFTTLSSDYSPQELSLLLNHIDPSIKKQIQQSLTDTALALPSAHHDHNGASVTPARNLSL